MEAAIGADERAFRTHTGRPDFEIGTAKGQWQLFRIDWPWAILTVTARDGIKWAFRFHLPGYPVALPNAQPWSLETDGPLTATHWPSGTGRVAAAFNHGWNTSALYLPCDRLALAGHEQWLVQHPEKAWPPVRGIVHYLEIIHDLLASHQYHSTVCAAA